MIRWNSRSAPHQGQVPDFTNSDRLQRRQITVGNFYLHRLNYSVYPPIFFFKKKNSKLSSFFSLHNPRPSPLNISSPIPPSSSSPISPPLPSVSSPFLRTLPHFPALALSLSVPLLGFSAPTSNAPSLPVPFGQIGPNGGPLFGLVWSNGGPLFGHGPPFCQIWSNEGLPFGQTGPNRGLPFGPVWPNDAERERGAEGRRGLVPESRMGTVREQVPGSQRALEESRWEGGVVPERGKGMVPERRRAWGKRVVPERRWARGARC